MFGISINFILCPASITKGKNCWMRQQSHELCLLCRELGLNDIYRSNNNEEKKMTRQNKGKALLENAYKLKTPIDNIAYYDEFAEVYDHDFASDMGWNYPQAIADIYLEIATAEDLPIADIGCGTGLVAERLGLARDSIDGFDISPEMLRIAESKSMYGALYQADLTACLASTSGNYGSVVSAGTFTHGHLGPDELTNVLTMGCSGSLFIIGINKVHFDACNFSSKIETLRADSRISNIKIREIPMYSTKNHDHGADIALALIFRKAE